MLYDTDKGRILLKRSLNWLNYNYPNRATNTSNKSKPSYYCLEKNQFDFASMSDASYTITFPYTKMHAAVTSNAIAIDFRETFRDVIKDLLKAELFELLEDWDKVSLYTNRGMLNLRILALIDKRNAQTILITQCNDY